MRYQLVSIFLLAQTALGALNIHGSKYGNKYENDRSPYYYGQVGKPNSKAPKDSVMEYRFEGTTTSGVTTGCTVSVQPDGRKDTIYFVVDTTGEEQIALRGSALRMTFPGPAIFPGLVRRNTVYFHEMCFPTQCGSGNCGFVTGPVTNTRSSVERRPCPNLEEPSENGTPAVTSHKPLRPHVPKPEPCKNSTATTPKASPCPGNTTKTTPEPCPQPPTTTTTAHTPCPETAAPESPTTKPCPPTTSPPDPCVETSAEQRQTPKRSRPSSGVKSSGSDASTSLQEDILSKLQRLIGTTNQNQQPLPGGSSSTVAHEVSKPEDPVMPKTAREAELHYSELPGAVRGTTGAIYYPSCSAGAYRQVAITPFCDTRRMRNRQQSPFADSVPSEDLGLFGL